MKLTNLKTLYKFTSSLFDREDQAWKAAMIILGILKARSPRITEVARAIPKPFSAGHKMIYRFLTRAPLKEALLRLLYEDAPFVICDPTEIPRPQARRTPYVGTLKDGKTRGFQLLVFSFPRKGPSRSGSSCSHPAPSPGRKPPGTWCTLRPSCR